MQLILMEHLQLVLISTHADYNIYAKTSSYIIQGNISDVFVGSFRTNEGDFLGHFRYKSGEKSEIGLSEINEDILKDFYQLLYQIILQIEQAELPENGTIVIEIDLNDM